ncbi:hypothetical protein BX666DRAFT_1944878 [Dichotomocladium elegans]|nr:hypothetical protein BX666DRAFT_1944878 [Dichotomocladium elegans]
MTEIVLSTSTNDPYVPDYSAAMAGPDNSISSASSPPTPPTAATAMAAAAAVAVNESPSETLLTPSLDQQHPSSTTTSTGGQLVTPLISSSTYTNTTTERVKETIARANTVPMEFYHTEFLEYSKETYEKKMDAKRNKRKRSSPEEQGQTAKKAKKAASQTTTASDDSPSSDKAYSDDDQLDDDEEIDREAKDRGVSTAELRRQIHIQSEQKRRAQIKNGFDDLRNHLPGCSNKKMSKAALLTRTVQQIQHLKNMQAELLSEVERLVQENETLKKFQHDVLQRQAMEKMYTF